MRRLILNCLAKPEVTFSVLGYKVLCKFIYPGMGNGMAGSYGSSISFFLSFLLSFCFFSTLTPIVPILVYSPKRKNVKGFHFSTFLTPIIVIWFLDSNYSDWGEMETQSSFNIHFSDSQKCLILFPKYLLAIFYFFF